MELPELRETVTELVEDVTRTEKALSQMDNALVVQVKRIEATEKAFSDLVSHLIPSLFTHSSFRERRLINSLD